MSSCRLLKRGADFGHESTERNNSLDGFVSDASDLLIESQLEIDLHFQSFAAVSV